MTQSTMTKPATSSTYNPYSDMDADKKKSDAATADSVSAEPVYKLVIDENVVEKISSMAAQKIDGIIDMKGNVLSRIQEGLGGADKTKGVDADIVDDTNAKINLDVIMEYGKSAPEIFDDIKKVVGGDLKDMTGLNVVEMTVNVVRHDSGRVRPEKRVQQRRRAAGRLGQLDRVRPQRRVAEPSRPRSAPRVASPSRLPRGGLFNERGRIARLPSNIILTLSLPLSDILPRPTSRSPRSARRACPSAGHFGQPTCPPLSNQN